MADEAKQGLWETFKGVWAAFLGVQSSKRQAEDFSRGSVAQYIIVGIVFVVLFILIIMAVVHLVLSSAGQS